MTTTDDGGIIPMTTTAAPRARTSHTTTTTNSNSGRSARLSIRSLLPSTSTNVPHGSTRSNSGSPSRLSSQLRRFICGCGVFYVAVVWYSGIWSSLSLSSAYSSTLAAGGTGARRSGGGGAELFQLPPQEVITRGRIAMEMESQEQKQQPMAPVLTHRMRKGEEDRDGNAALEPRMDAQNAVVAQEEPPAAAAPTVSSRTSTNAVNPDLSAPLVQTEAPAAPIADQLPNAVDATSPSPTLDPNKLDLLAPLDLPDRLKKLFDPKQPLEPDQTAQHHRMSPKEAFHARQRSALSAAKLTPEQIAALTPQQAAALTMLEEYALTAEERLARGEQPSAATGYGATASLTPEQIAALTPEQSARLQAIDKYALAAKQRQERTPAPTVDPNLAAAIRLAEDHARTVKQMPRGETKKRRLKCIGWRATEGCDPDGKRKPADDRTCVRFVDPSASGYCEVEDRDTGERFRVMKRQCDSVHRESRFRCFESWDFSNFAIAADTTTKAAQAEMLAKQPPVDTESTATAHEKNGILIVIYPKLIPSAYAIVRTLRAQNCTLPIEFWYRKDELDVHHPTLEAMEQAYGPVVFRAIRDQRATGFATKISAITNSEFDNLLFLDADNFPVEDPTYLFELPEFKDSGAIFWPDFWHPEHTIFNIHKNSLLWQLVDMPFVDMFEQESGQLLLNKKRNAMALELMQFYTFHRPNHFEKFRLAHGDKDLFRLAWLKTNTPFHFIAHPPGVAGKLQNETFCGMTMVQRDPQGDVLFLHRNAKKLTGRKFHYDHLNNEGEKNQEDDDVAAAAAAGKAKFAKFTPTATMETDDPAVWSHMLLFKPTSRRSDFVIDIFEGAPDFPVGQWCYGKKTLATPHFNVFAFDKLEFADLETQIIAYAVEASEMAARKPKQPAV